MTITIPISKKHIIPLLGTGTELILWENMSEGLIPLRPMIFSRPYNIKNLNLRIRGHLVSVASLVILTIKAQTSLHKRNWLEAKAKVRQNRDSAQSNHHKILACVLEGQMTITTLKKAVLYTNISEELQSISQMFGHTSVR
jgi:hypothetical protein